MSITIEPKMEGARVRVTVRSGAEGSRALCGVLVMRPHEWETLLGCLQLPNHPGRLENGATDVFVLAASVPSPPAKQEETVRAEWMGNSHREAQK